MSGYTITDTRGQAILRRGRSGRRRAVLAGPALLALLAAGPASAQARAESGGAEIALDTISVQDRRREDPLGPVEGYRAERATTATKTDTPIIETPQSVSVVTRDVIEDRRAETVAETLRTVPGFVAAQTYAFQNAYLLRGFAIQSGDLTANYRDGRRILNLAAADPELLERIEVIKGPSSVLLGALEPGGLVDLVSKRPILGALSSGWVKQEVGSFGDFKSVLDLNVPLGEAAALRLPASWRRFDSYRDLVDGNRSFDLAPALSLSLSERTRLTLLTRFTDQKQTDDSIYAPVIDGRVLPLPRRWFLGEPGARSSVRSGAVSAELEHAFSDAVKLRSS